MTAGTCDGVGASTVRFPGGVSSAIRQINQLIQMVACYDSTVLILGESGTGKEVVARAVHEASPRAARPFVPVNCGAIPSELMESELFGHERGAFTGAVGTRKGRFELAEGGTLFLDEIGDMSPTMQVKLLRVLQERTFERVGGTQTQHCDVRIVAATHRNLEEAIQKGSFREDLFYRLNVFPLEMPPLRDRIEDLESLIEDISRHLPTIESARVRLSTDAVAALRQYRWPGNVRELGNLLERLSIQCGDRLVRVADLPARYRPPGWEPGPEDAEAEQASPPVAPRNPAPAPRDAAPPPAAQSRADPAPDSIFARMPLASPDVEVAPDPSTLPDQGIDLRAYLDQIEQLYIEQALRRSGGIVAHAARLLGLRRTTLVEKLRKHAITADDSRTAEP